MIVVLLQPECAAAVVGAGRLGIELESLVEIGHRITAAVQLDQGEAAVGVGADVLRVELDGPVEVLDGLFQLAGRYPAMPRSL